MKSQQISKVDGLLQEALSGVDGYVENWSKEPKPFTTLAELDSFGAKLREMKKSLSSGNAVRVIGLWRIMDTWPYKDAVRAKIVEAELAYERLTNNKAQWKVSLA